MEIEKYIILSDAQLVVLALDGDSVAFETLFKRYREEIYALCIGRTAGNKEDANDLVQDTFVKVYLNLEKYDPNFSPLSLAAPFLSPTQSHSLKVFVFVFCYCDFAFFFFLLFILLYIKKIFLFFYLFFAIVITGNYRY